MWFKIEDKRAPKGNRFLVRCTTELAGKSVTEERAAQGVTVAKNTAELLASSFNATATVYASDAQGEFVFGVYEVADRASAAESPLIKRLYAESAVATLSLRDEMLAKIPEEAIRGFAALAASLGTIVDLHKETKRSVAPQIRYSTLFRIFCGDGSPSVLSLAADDATLALLGARLIETAGWTHLGEINGVGVAERQAINPHVRLGKVTLNIDGKLDVIPLRAVFRGTLPSNGAHFVLVLEMGARGAPQTRADSVGLIYREADEAEVVALARGLLQDANPFKNRVVLMNRDLRTVRSRISARTWSDVIAHERAKEELDFIAASIRDREMLKSEGLTIKRGLLLSGPPGDGKSTAIECFANDIAGEATIIIVEAVDHIRYVYHLAQQLAPAVVVLEDLDLITKSRQLNLYGGAKEGVTGELLQVLSGGSEYADIITIATTNHPEAIDEALSKRAGRFDAHVRMGYPSEDAKRRILDLYLDRFSVSDELTRRRLHAALARELGKLHLVPAHIEEFVKAGVKRARLARRAAEFADFEPAIDAVKSIANQKPAVAGQ